MYDPSSRYYNLKTLKYRRADGSEVPYSARRFCPRDGGQARREVAVTQNDRLDLISWRAVGSPTLFWRVADLNKAMNPFRLTAVAGRNVFVPR